MFEQPPQPDWEVTIFPPMPLSVGMAEDHPLAKERSLTIPQLANEAFLENPADPAAAPSGSEVLVNRLFARQGVARNIVQRLDDPHLAVGLAAAGVGIVVASLETARGVPGLRIVPLSDPDAILTCGAVSRRSNETALLHACRLFLRQRALTFDQIVAA
jgi:DNA-binding transcriptional LysR family regulator